MVAPTSNEKKVVTWPHAEGIARLAFSPDGLFLYTSGSEGYMRVFDASITTKDPFDPRLIEYHEEAMTSISCTNEYLCSANESGVVALHTSGKDNVFVKLVTRCNLPIRSARFDARGKRIAVASDELIVKVIDTRDPTKVQLLAGHKKGVREASWCPDGSLLSTSGSDGEIRIWELNGTEGTCVKVLEGIIPVAEPESEYTVEVVWHPSGKYFVVPTKTNEIAIISRDGWSKIGAFSKDGHTTQISSLAFSPNGSYLVSTAKDVIIIWSTATRLPVTRSSHTLGLITAIAFHPSPTANALAYVDFSGQLTRWQDPIPSNLIGPSVGALKLGGAEEEEEEEEEEMNAEPAGREGDEGEEAAGKSRPREESAMLEDDWIDDDFGNGVDENTYAGVDLKRKETERRREASYSGAYGGSSYVSSAVGQPSFQPGSTSFREKRRYLAFNMLGLIHVVERDDQNIVTIEFHDRSSHPGSHFNDPHKFTLGALGELGALFACTSNGESPSLIYYRPYESWTDVQEWQYHLPLSENVVCIAVGGLAEPLDENEIGIAGTGTVLVATDKGFVRFLSGSGLQKYVWNLGEEVVTMAAGKDWALIVYRGAPVADGKQNLEYALVDTDTFEIVQQGSMPLRKGTTLKWVGFTEDHIPMMYDSNGLFSLLDRSRRPRQGRWVPALDTNTLARKEGKQESYWPIGVTEQHAHVVILKGEEKSPHFPTPLFQEIDFQVPLLRLDVQQGQLEEQYLRETLFVSHRRDGASLDDYSFKAQLARQEMEIDKHLLKIIQTSCKAEKLQAALDAALLLTQPASLDAAAKIAAFFSLPALEERITLVKESKTGLRKFDDDNKRGGKWTHLIDDRTIVAAPSHRSNGKSSNLFSGGGNSYSPRPSANFSAFGSGRKSGGHAGSTPASSKRARNNGMEDSGFEDNDAGEMMQVDDENEGEQEEEDGGNWQGDDDDDERAAKRSRSASQGEEEEQMGASPEPIVPKKAANPFAKRAPVLKPDATPSSPNPFAAPKKAGAKNIARKDSFFQRVEGDAPPKPKAARSNLAGSAAPAAAVSVVPGTKQTTLFGVAPPDPAKLAAEREKKSGKKRKTTEEESQSAAAQPKTTKGIEAFLKPNVVKELPREGEEFEETQLAEETQGETQMNEKRKVERVEEEMETQEEEEGETQIETQEETQEETQAQEDTPKEAPMSGVSKLAQFRRVV